MFIRAKSVSLPSPMEFKYDFTCLTEPYNYSRLQIETRRVLRSILNKNHMLEKNLISHLDHISIACNHSELFRFVPILQLKYKNLNFSLKIRVFRNIKFFTKNFEQCFFFFLPLQIVNEQN